MTEILASTISAPVTTTNKSIETTISVDGRIITSNIVSSEKVISAPIGVGRKGDKGDQGIQGEQGVQGNASTIPGPQGETGLQGIQGIKGDTGDTGAKGDIGVKGDQGNIGLQGIQGEIGSQGLQGPKGDTGDQGIQGIQGIQGLKGDDGNIGPQGSQGPQGIQGIQGIPGVITMATFNGQLDFVKGNMIATATIADATMTTTKVISAFFTDNLDEVAVLNMRVNERSRSVGVGFDIIGIAPNGAFGIYPVRIITQGE